MKIIEKPIGYYIKRITRGDFFSFAGYSDAEWLCMFGCRAGELTGFGQILDPTHGKRLIEVLHKRQNDPRFLVAVPKILYSRGGFNEGELDWCLGRNNLLITAYERDMVTDDLAAEAGLYPLVKKIRETRSAVMIGNHALEPMTEILRLKKFIGVSSPNLHLEEGGIERAVEEAKSYGRSGIYLVSAGVSAAVIIDLLHDEIPHSFFIDCGSIWDAFVGIGGQREWRAKLYDNPKELERWKRRNLGGN